MSPVAAAFASTWRAAGVVLVVVVPALVVWVEVLVDGLVTVGAPLLLDPQPATSNSEARTHEARPSISTMVAAAT
jgi:hypothetical protein